MRNSPYRIGAAVTALAWALLPMLVSAQGYGADNGAGTGGTGSTVPGTGADVPYLLGAYLVLAGLGALIIFWLMSRRRGDSGN